MAGQLLATSNFGTDAAANDNSVPVYRIDDHGTNISATSIATITPSASGTNRFGKRIEFLGKRLLVSDPQAVRPGTTAKGVVHVYRVELDGTVVSEGTLSSQTNGANELFGEFLDVDSTTLGEGLLAVGVKLDGSSATSDHDIQLFSGTLPVPEIEVRQPTVSILHNGGSRNFGKVALNATKSLVFTVKNTGTADLTGLDCTFHEKSRECSASQCPRSGRCRVHLAAPHTTLQPGSWTSIADTGTATQRLFSVPIGSHKQLFTRLTVTSP